jgi:hypothetical protein
MKCTLILWFVWFDNPYILVSNCNRDAYYSGKGKYFHREMDCEEVTCGAASWIQTLVVTSN